MVKGLSMIASFAGGMAQRALNERDRKNKIKDAVELQEQLLPINLKAFEEQAKIKFPFEEKLKQMEVDAAVQKSQAIWDAKQRNQEAITRGVYSDLGINKVFTQNVVGQDAASRDTSRYAIYTKAYQPLIQSVKDGKITIQDLYQKMKDNGDYAGFSNFITQRYNTENNNFRKNYPDQRTRLAPTTMFGTLTPIAMPMIDAIETAGLSPEIQALGPAYKTIHGHRIVDSIFNVFKGAPNRFLGHKDAITKNLTNKEFFTLNKNYNDPSGGITDSQFLTQAKGILGIGAKSNAEVREIVGLLTSYAQPLRTFSGGVQQEPQYIRAPKKENAAQELRLRKNLSDGAEDVGLLVLEGNPNVSSLSSSLEQSIGTAVSGVRELNDVIKKYIGIDVGTSSSQNRHVDFATETIASIDATGLDAETKTDLNNRINRTTGEINKIVEELQSDSGTLSEERRSKLEDTYKYHMKKLYLTFAFSKYIQGGAGGNAVSNADFANTARALFGTFSVDPVENRYVLAGGMADLHFSLEESRMRAEADDVYQVDPDGKGQRIIVSPTIRKLNRDRLARLRKARDQGAHIYWSQVTNRNIADPRGQAVNVQEDRLKTRKKIIDANTNQSPPEQKTPMSTAPMPDGNNLDVVPTPIDTTPIDTTPPPDTNENNNADEQIDIFRS